MMYLPNTDWPKAGPWRIWIEAGPTVFGSSGELNVNFRTRLSGTLSSPSCAKLVSTTPVSVSPDPEPPPPPQPAYVAPTTAHPATIDAIRTAETTIARFMKDLSRTPPLKRRPPHS